MPGAAGAFELVARQGAPGLVPEGTLVGFATALAIGVDALEVTLAVTADDQLVAVGGLRLDPELTRGPDGAWVAPPGPTVRALTLEALRGYDVGRPDLRSRRARRFPDQRPADGARIATLAEVVALAGRAGNTGVRFDLVLLGDPREPDLTVAPERITALVIDEARRLGIAGRVTIGALDWRVPHAAQALAPEIPTACRTVEQPWLDTLARGRPGPSPWTAGLDIDAMGGSVPDLVKAAGCRVWAPYHMDLHALSLGEAHSQGLAVVPWTVDEPAVMEGLIEGGVDGIVTDQPGLLRDLLARKHLPLPPATPP